MNATTKYPREVEIRKKGEVINRARSMWKTICAENMTNYGDKGSCVLGAGIAVCCIPKGCRLPKSVTLISSDEVCTAQGSMTWERGMDVVIKFLKDYGIDAYYESGNMD